MSTLYNSVVLVVCVCVCCVCMYQCEKERLDLTAEVSLGLIILSVECVLF